MTSGGKQSGGLPCSAGTDTDASITPTKKPRLSSNDEESATASCVLSLPDLVLDAILSHCTSVDMVRLCLTSRTWQDWPPAAERVAAAIVQAERDRIYWGLLLYGRGSRCFEYGEGPKLRRLYELEKSTMASYHYPSLDGAAQFLRAGGGQGRGTAAELHCPNRSAMMHDSMGGLVQAMGGRTKDKVKFIQTKRAIPASTDKQFRFVVKVIYRDYSIGERDNVFLGVINEKYEPPYRSRDASKHKKSVNNGRFVRLPCARKDLGQSEVVVGVALDMERREMILDYPNGESNETRIDFAQLRGEEFRIAFRQEQRDPQGNMFYGVLDIAMRELDHGGYEKLMADERATKESRAAAALASVKRGELVEHMKHIFYAAHYAGIADTPVKGVNGVTVGRTVAIQQWYCKHADLSMLNPVDPAERYPKLYLAEVIEKSRGMNFNICKAHDFVLKIRSSPDRMKLYSRFLLEEFGEACAEIGDGNILEEACDIIQTKFDEMEEHSESEETLQEIEWRVDAFDRIKAQVKERLTEIEAQT